MCCICCLLPAACCLQLRKMQLFSEADHPNTLAAAAPPAAPGLGSITGLQSPDHDHLWVMLHNLGPVGSSYDMPDTCVACAT
jgi:hypothetical protein